MEPASRPSKQHQVQRLHQPPAGHQINNKPVSTKVEAALVSQKPYHHQPPQDGQISSSKVVNKSQVWDCGSSLYDSFELDSFNRHLDSAIKASSRTLSMPHLPDRRAPPPAPEHLPVTLITKRQTLPDKAGKLSTSFKKILRSVFGSSTTINNATNRLSIKPKSSEKHKDSFSFYDGSKSVRVLTTIPELQEIDGRAKFSPESTPVVRRTASERFTPATVSVSCASR